MSRIARFLIAVPLAVAALPACQPPPPAPDGLDESAAYVMREFYRDDAFFQAGLQGFMNWYYEEGYLLVGERATNDNTDSFTVNALTLDDVGHLPSANDNPDPTLAGGVVSLAEMECGWTTAEEYLVRPDQNTVFDGDWEAYDRTYVSSRTEFEGATTSSTFAPVDEDLDPFSEGFDPAPTASTLLFTVNSADPSAVVFADLPAYNLYLDLRHGVYDLENEAGEIEPTGVFAILTYIRDEIWDDGEENALLQSYSVEINVQRPGDRTLRMLAVWAEPQGGGLEPNDPVVLNYAVNKALSSSERLSEICAGTVEVPGE